MNGRTGTFRRRRALEVSLDAVLDTAERALRRGHGRAAYRLVGQVLTLEPRQARAMELLSRIALDQGSVFDALAYLQRALEIEPDRANWHHAMGVMCRQTGRYADAAAALRTAIRLRPYRAESMVELALALSAVGVREDAEYWAARALQINPKLQDARDLLDHLVAQGMDAA